MPPRVRGFKRIDQLEAAVSPTVAALLPIRQGSKNYKLTIEELLGLLSEGDWSGTFDGEQGDYYRARANHTGTQLAATISDFMAAVQGVASGISLNDLVGVLTAIKGGTGQSSYATGDLLTALTTTTLTKIAAVAAGNVFLSGGVGAIPFWGKVDLLSHVANVLPAANGGKDTQPNMPWNGVTFDGTDDYYTGINFSGIADGKEGTLCIWIYFTDAAASRPTSEYIFTNTGEALAIYRKTNGQVEVRVENAAGAVICLITGAVGAASNAGLYCLRAAWNTVASGNSRLRVNRFGYAVSTTATETTFVQDGIADYTVTGWSIASRSTGVNGYTKGTVYLIWLSTVYLDVNLQDVDSRFIDAAGRPVFLGNNGELPTGSVPVGFFAYDKLKNWKDNRGFGLGNMTENSTPTEAANELRGQYFPGAGRDKTDANASAITLTKLDTGKIFSNEGAAANVVFTLPAADAASEFGLYCANVNGLQVTATNGNTIIVDGAETAANGSISTIQIGAFVRLKAISRTKWAATVTIGDWTGRTLRAGVATFSGAVTVTNTAPFIEWNESDRAANEKAWRIYGTGAQFNLYPVSDAGVLGAVALSFTRSGNAAVAATFGVPVVLPTDPVNALEAATKQYVDGKSLIGALRKVTTAGAITVLSTDSTVVVKKVTGAATAVTLEASPATGRRVRIKDGKGDAATNNITVTPASGTIDGAANKVIAVNYASLDLEFNGDEWGVV